MGLLDNKSRIIDAIVTVEGRRQIASGDLHIKYVTFSDSCTFYEADAISGSSDATERVYFEACSLPQDQITFEADDSGKLKPFPANSNLFLNAGQLVSRNLSATTSSFITGSVVTYETLTGETFASQISGILTSSIDNFQKLQIIGTFDKTFEDEGFAVSPSELTFTITDYLPLVNNKTVNVNTLESLFNDSKLSHVKNFAYLPPINKQSSGVSDKREILPKIGNYAFLGGAETNVDEYYVSLREQLKLFESIGFCKNISFDPTSKMNNLVAQVFEVNDSSATKLDVLHLKNESFTVSNTISDVFFIGKVVVDNKDTQSFVHLFTLIFE